MLYNTVEYLLFFIVVFFCFWGLAKYNLLKLLFLLGASYFFYMNWNPLFILLIIGDTLWDFFCGKAIYRAKTPRTRKLFLIVSLIGNLGILFFFKYANFFITSLETLFKGLGLNIGLPQVSIILPVGISFFTFQSLTYTIDIYRRVIKPSDSLLKYSVYIAFFPNLVAGPIVRAKEFLPQLEVPAAFSPQRHSEGLFLILGGLFKKMVIADFLAINLVDRIFSNPERYSSLEVLAGIYGYTFQIYCDFSGYTDIAIGSALLIGVQLPLNFNNPYRAVNLRDFWRRWHISLSTWLRDYLYISLGGGKGSEFSTYINLMTTMLLGGLWHGAAWTFVIWGGLHGLGLVFTRIYQRYRAKKGQKTSPSILIKALGIFLTFHFVVLCWVFFRAASFENAMTILKQLLNLTLFIPNLTWQILLVLGLGFLTNYIPDRFYDQAKNGFIRLPAPIQALILAISVIVFWQMATSKVVPFIYFQF